MLTETTRLRPDGIGTDVRKNARSTIVLFQELNRCVLYLIRCRCQPDIEMSDNVKLFVGNLPLDATHDELNSRGGQHLLSPEAVCVHHVEGRGRRGQVR